jgi:hypothetical protein
MLLRNIYYFGPCSLSNESNKSNSSWGKKYNDSILHRWDATHAVTQHLLLGSMYFV